MLRTTAACVLLLCVQVLTASAEVHVVVSNSTCGSAVSASPSTFESSSVPRATYVSSVETVGVGAYRYVVEDEECMTMPFLTNSSFQASCFNSLESSTWVVRVWANVSTRCHSAPTFLEIGSGDTCLELDGDRGLLQFVPITNVTYRTVNYSVWSISCGLPRQRPTLDEGCFPAGSLVLMADGRRVPIERVKVDDWVMALSADGAGLEPQRVFRIGHEEPDAQATFMDFELASGRRVRMTGEHFVPVGRCCMERDCLREAKAVVEGDLLCTEDAKLERVVSVSRSAASGLFNLHTLTASYVVDGVVVSHFTTESMWWSWLYPLATTWYQLVDALM